MDERTQFVPGDNIRFARKHRRTHKGTVRSVQQDHLTVLSERKFYAVRFDQAVKA